MPSFLRKALNYLDETTKWMLAGEPVVSDEIRAFRRAQCQECEHRDAEKDECKVCGCFLHRTTLGDKLAMATASCPLPQPKWKAIYTGEDAIEVPFPTWRQVCIWIDHAGKPTYVDGLSLCMDDVIIQDVFLDRSEDKGLGFGRTYYHLRDLITSNFTGEVEVVVQYELWRSQLTGDMKIDFKKGKVRFESGKPVGVS